MKPTPALALVREAFEAAREKHFLLARLLYPSIFGVRWRAAILAFAYLKCLDDLVDEDDDATRAIAQVERQRSLLARWYAGERCECSEGPERFAAPVIAGDCGSGSLRAPLEAILASMEFDTRRRGETLAAAALDTYVLDLGRNVIRIFAHLVTPGAGFSAAAVDEGIRAYLYADALIDLEPDLARGVINVPREDARRFDLRCRPGEARLDLWVAERVPRVLAHFARAREQLRSMRSRRLRLFLSLFLFAKARKLRGHLATRPRWSASHAAAALGANGRA